MDKGGRPCGKSAATLKREREAEEKVNPESRQRRMEDETFRRMNFFAGHTRATVSAGADTVCADVLTVHLFFPTSICLRICMIDWKTAWVGITKVRNMCVCASCSIHH
jgi:hypothetical protein